ncbi:MAG TPA: HAD family hydrolase [Microvirga sp.]|nr:HAD family hydrolase [Microvirga sp.]
MMLRPPIAVFDLDGTLADTIHDLIGTLNVVLGHEGVPRLSVQDGRAMVSAGARALIERGLAAAGREVVPARLDELHRLFLAHYSEHLCDATSLFPGVVDALDRLEAAGFRLAVCTNKHEAYSVEVLEGLGVAHRFAAICGRDSFPYFKPDPRHLLLTVEKAGGDPGRAVMVGDSITDIATARAAGIPAVAVSFGYSDIPVDRLQPDIVIDHYGELFAAVQMLTRAAPSVRAPANVTAA